MSNFSNFVKKYKKKVEKKLFFVFLSLFIKWTLDLKVLNLLMWVLLINEKRGEREKERKNNPSSNKGLGEGNDFCLSISY